MSSVTTPLAEGHVLARFRRMSEDVTLRCEDSRETDAPLHPLLE